MALQEDATSLNGVETIYHRIASATIDYTIKEATIVVYSYTDEKMRQHEKEIAAKQKNEQGLRDELDKLLRENAKTNQKRIVELSNTINDMTPLTPDDVAPRHAWQDRYTITIESDKDYSLEMAYAWLKENVYKESKDV